MYGNPKRFFIVMLFFILLPAVVKPSFIFSQDEPKQKGGNRTLMEQWVEKKQALKQKVYEKIQEHHELPRDGVIEFEALVKRDPEDKEKIYIQLDELHILNGSSGEVLHAKPTEERQKEQVRKIWEPIDISEYIRYEEIELDQREKTVIKDVIEVRGGRFVGGGSELTETQFNR